MIIRALIAFGIVVSAAAPAFAGANCVCRANGKDFEEGQIACLRLPSGMRLARCERVLNNTSWKMLGEGCPTATMTPDAPAVPISLPASRIRQAGEG